jgi:hypothetical protein
MMTGAEQSKLTLLSYGHPRADYLGGYWNRLLRGPLGLLNLCYTVQDGVECKATRGLVPS